MNLLRLLSAWKLTLRHGWLVAHLWLSVHRHDLLFISPFPTSSVQRQLTGITQNSLHQIRAVSLRPPDVRFDQLGADSHAIVSLAWTHSPMLDLGWNLSWIWSSSHLGAEVVLSRASVFWRRSTTLGGLVLGLTWQLSLSRPFVLGNSTRRFFTTFSSLFGRLILNDNLWFI